MFLVLLPQYIVLDVSRASLHEVAPKSRVPLGSVHKSCIIVVYIVKICKYWTYMWTYMHRTHRYTGSIHIRLAFQMHAALC